MPTWYSGRAYSAYGWPLGWLRLVGVDAGRVANGVAEAEIVAVGPFAHWWRDIAHVDVWRYSGLGYTNRWGCYYVRGWNEKYDSFRTTYAFRGMSEEQLFAGRPATSSSVAAAQDTYANQANSIVDTAISAWLTSLTVVYTATDGPPDTVTIKASNQNALAALQSLVGASRAAPASTYFNFAVWPTIRSDNTLALGVATWQGEYGADRRAKTGSKPYVLWLKSKTDKYEALRDERGALTVVNLASGQVTNDAALNNPYGNYWATNDGSSGTEATANALKTLWQNRPVTKLSPELSIDIDAVPLGLGDVISVVYGRSLVDGRVNVMHTSWTETGEKIIARVDIEI